MGFWDSVGELLEPRPDVVVEKWWIRTPKDAEKVLHHLLDTKYPSMNSPITGQPVDIAGGTGVIPILKWLRSVAEYGPDYAGARNALRNFVKYYRDTKHDKIRNYIETNLSDLVREEDNRRKREEKRLETKRKEDLIVKYAIIAFEVLFIAGMVWLIYTHWH